MSGRTQYLYLSRHNIFYFRIIVTVDTNGCNVKNEYRRSLATRDPALARRLGRAMRACLDECSDVRRVDVMEWPELKQILDQRLLQLIAHEQDHVAKKGPYPIGMEDVWECNALPYQQEVLGDMTSAMLGGSEISTTWVPEFLSTMVNQIIKEHNIDLSASQEQYRQFCEAVLQMNMAFIRERIAINRRARSFGVAQSLPVDNPSRASDISQTLVSKVVDEYCAEMIAGDNWTKKTQDEYQAAYTLFIKVMGDMPIANVDYAVSKHFKSALQRLPTHMTKKPLYRERTIPDILAMQIPKEHLLSITKVNQNVSRISSLFKWAQNNKYVTNNPFTGLKIKEKESASSKRLPFSNEDLVKLFSSKEYQQGNLRNPYYYWLPLLGLYTGARIEELCQLHLDDIYQKDGLLVIDICRSEDTKVKTDSGQRVIPVHSRLIELGLKDYIERLLSSGAKHLFPELKKERDGYSQSASKWFGRYRKRNGVADPKKPFHSFRHTVVDHLKQKHIAKELIAAIVGHKDESITTGLYGKEYEPSSLKPIVEQLIFPINVSTYFDLIK